jgi:hypothetical protein
MLHQLSLTHFCEVHGPKSILCTQVLPLECAICLPPHPILHSQSSDDSFTTRVHSSSSGDESFHPSALQRTETNTTLPTDFSGASTSIDSEPPSPTLERHPFYQNLRNNFGPQFKYGRAQGDTCSSCSFTVPKNIAEKLPAGAPGCLQPDGKPLNGAPVLRSREVVCLGEDRQPDSPKPSSSYGSKASSIQSRRSSHHPPTCHDHTLTYLTAKSPESPTSYTTLRAAVIRTLSCEVLPRGMSDGPLCFGDPTTGYTIAWVFRLTDPVARGRRRAYAFVALAGRDTARAFRACPMVWEAFAAVAKGIETKAQLYQEAGKVRDEPANGRDYTPVSSFLTQRVTDPDGHPRGTRSVPPRSLADIVGDEHIFTYLHQYFVAVLRCLGDRFGGLPLVDAGAGEVFQTKADGDFFKEGKLPSTLHAEIVDELARVRDDDNKTPTPGCQQRQGKARDEIEEAKMRINRSVKRNSKCMPVAVKVEATRQVVV